MTFLRYGAVYRKHMSVKCTEHFPSVCERLRSLIRIFNDCTFLFLDNYKCTCMKQALEQSIKGKRL